MPEAVVRRHLVMHGFVQGVCFRHSAQQCARRNGVTGWVTNRPDGTVEAILEGPAAAVQAVESFCAEGPEPATVQRIEGFDEKPEGLSGFSVR